MVSKWQTGNIKLLTMPIQLPEIIAAPVVVNKSK